MPREFLRRYPLFALLGSRQLDAWLAAGQELTFTTGETLSQERTEGVWAYVILEGRVRILRRGRIGRELSLGTAGPGEVFGDYALLPPHRNTATCRAADPTRLFRLPLAPLRAIVAAHPDIETNLKRWLRLHALLKHLRGGTFLGFMSALAMVARHHGSRTPLRRSVRHSGRGISLLEMQILAGAAGLSGQAVRADPDHLADVRLPAIAHLTDGHYVVVFERDPCRLVIGDPTTGIVTLSESEFKQLWSGCLLLLSADP